MPPRLRVGHIVLVEEEASFSSSSAIRRAAWYAKARYCRLRVRSNVVLVGDGRRGRCLLAYGYDPIRSDSIYDITSDPIGFDLISQISNAIGSDLALQIESDLIQLCQI